MAPAFLLVGLPGLEAAPSWWTVPLVTVYLLSALGNGTILWIIALEPTLHRPMYFFLFLLSVSDVGLATVLMPTLLGLAFADLHAVPASACLLQMLFVHVFSVMESSVLLAMAFDRAMAICRPLHYPALLTNGVVSKIGMAIAFRCLSLHLPLPFLISRMPFCPNKVIPQSYCEHMAVLKLVCADTKINRGYGLFVAFSVVGFDIIVISVSYVMILRAVLRLPSGEARLKAFGTCASHVCVILAFYIPALFTFLTHRFGHHVPHVVHIMFANVYLLVPPMLNPIIYGVRTKQIRDRVTRGVCRKDP
ncbi:Olfactory receptor 52R1 [Lemmus lemmus]